MYVSEGLTHDDDTIAASVCDKQVLNVVRLVERIENRSFRIAPHSSSAHFVNGESRRVIPFEWFYILAPTAASISAAEIAMSLRNASSFVAPGSK